MSKKHNFLLTVCSFLNSQSATARPHLVINQDAHTMTRPSTASRQRNWSDLPDGLLHTILSCLCSLVDFISFSSVCRSWRAITSSISPSWTTSHFSPLLFCRTFSSSSTLSSLRLLNPASPSFSSPLSHNSYEFQLTGSFSYSHGHLFRFISSLNRIVILNPFIGVALPSPLFPQDCKIYNPLPVLISPLSSPDSGVLVFTAKSEYKTGCSTLHYWQIGSPSWSSHCLTVKLKGHMFSMVVATVQGKVYVMDSQQTLFVLDLSPQLHLRKLAVDVLEERDTSFRQFLVACDGELLLVLLVLTHEQMMNAQLQVYRLDSSVNGTRWVKQETLGNWAIFVGYDSRAQGLAIQNPERWGGRNNCVYFATTGNQNRDWPWVAIKVGDVIDRTNTELPLFKAGFDSRACFHGFILASRKCDRKTLVLE